MSDTARTKASAEKPVTDRLIETASNNTLAINPLIGLSRRDVASAAKSLLKAVAGTPRKAGLHYGRYVKELARVVRGKSELAPEPKDRRFADPAWKNNALYTRLMQSYLATQKELAHFIDTAELNKVEKGRAQFFASLVTDALAPSNWLFGNPVAVRKKYGRVSAERVLSGAGLANVYLAITANLEIVPVINKIDLPGANPDAVIEQIEDVIGIDASGAVFCSAKTGIGIDELLEAIVLQIPPPRGDENAPLQALRLEFF